MKPVCQVASHGFHDESGEIAAVQALLEDVSVAGRVITVDALHTVRDTARSIVETHKADYLMTVKANAPETFATPRNDQLGTGCHRVIRGGVHQGTWSH